MAKRLRDIRHLVSFTPEEWRTIQAKMAKANMTNFSNFAREMLLTGEVKHYDFAALRELSREMGRVAGSLNQVAKRCNETRNVHTADVEEIRDAYMKIKTRVQGRLVAFLNKL